MPRERPHHRPLTSRPVDGIKKPRWESRGRYFWTTDETPQFLGTALATPGRWYPLFGLLAVSGVSGLRISETLALTWADAEGDRQTVRVGKALVWPGDRCTALLPSAKAGRRPVMLPAIGVALVSRMPRGNPAEPVFRASTAHPPGHQRWVHQHLPLSRMLAPLQGDLARETWMP